MRRKCRNCPRKYVNIDFCPQIEVFNCDYTYLENDLLEAIKEFYKNDIELISRSVHELCITGHIFHYFSSKFAEKYSQYNMDPEYNRNGNDPKRYVEDKYARPDMIIHKRNCNKYNLLYIEFKVNGYSYDQHDTLKIKEFVSDREHSYNYKYGVSVILGLRDVKMLWYKNGENDSIAESVFDVKTWRKRNA